LQLGVELELEATDRHAGDNYVLEASFDPQFTCATAGANGIVEDFSTELHAVRQVREGRDTFRYATFGDEAFWGDALGLHLALLGAANSGVGPGVSPATALSVGLKVDVDALPRSLIRSLARGEVDLQSPATTVALLKLDAVVGVTGVFDKQGHMTSMGIQCSLCHSTVDDSFAPGIGHRRDGWANRDLNVGAIVALAPRLDGVATLLGVDVPTVRAVLNSWGPGRFDAELTFLEPEKQSLHVLARDKRWQHLQPGTNRTWTDDFSNIWSVIQWRH